MANIDLDLIFPEKDNLSFTSRDGKKIDIELFLSPALAIVVQKEVTEGKEFDMNLELVSVFLSQKYDYASVEWVRANIDIPQIRFITEVLLATMNETTTYSDYKKSQGTSKKK